MKGVIFLNRPSEEQYKTAVYTLGCKVNYFESEALKEQFRRHGFSVVEGGEKADIYVVNSCAVTHQAARKSRQLVRKLKKFNPEAFIVLAGCYPQADPDEATLLPEVDLFTGTGEKLLLPELVKRKLAGEREKNALRPYLEDTKEVFEDMPWTPEQGRTRAFLKIQDGCRQFCTYCIIPLARGPLRSLAPERGMHYLREIGRSGFKEVVLTGIHLGLYGIDLAPPVNLTSFLKMAVTVEGIERIRLSSLEPADITEELIETICWNEKICRHLHIPLQSGDDTVLQRMGRPYNTDYFSKLLNRLYSKIPDLAVSTDVMVGFPGEDGEKFRQSLEFVQSSAFSRLHVFKYSPRKGTRAAQMTPQVEAKEKERRSKEMIQLGQKLARSFQDTFLGRTLPVLLEKEENLQGTVFWEGLTSNYLRVRVNMGGGNWKGKMANVRLEESMGGFLKGRHIE